MNSCKVSMRKRCARANGFNRESSGKRKVVFAAGNGKRQFQNFMKRFRDFRVLISTAVKRSNPEVFFSDVKSILWRF